MPWLFFKIMLKLPLFILCLRTIQLFQINWRSLIDSRAERGRCDVFPERGRNWPPPLTREDPHTTKRAVSVCPHFLASISSYRVSDDRTCALIFIAESELTTGKFRKPYFNNCFMVMWQVYIQIKFVLLQKLN